MNDINKIKVWMGVMLLWGILTGRVLPQWLDIAQSPYWWGEMFMYWLMLLIGLIVIWQQHNIIKIKQSDVTK